MGAARPFRQAVKCGVATIASAMRRSIALAGITISAVALLSVGASGAGYYRPSKEAVIAAALEAPQLDGFASSFPRRPQGHRCRAHPGGPARQPSEPRICWTSVALRPDGSAFVTFMRSTRYAGKLDMDETWV